jgi:predicted CopG family antitoxin
MINMTSKTISITEEVYNELMKIKGDHESFSQLFLRILKFIRQNIEQSFGTWDLTEEEKKEIWDNLVNRAERRWNHSKAGDIV